MKTAMNFKTILLILALLKPWLKYISDNGSHIVSYLHSHKDYGYSSAPYCLLIFYFQYFQRLKIFESLEKYQFSTTASYTEELGACCYATFWHDPLISQISNIHLIIIIYSPNFILSLKRAINQSQNQLRKNISKRCHSNHEDITTSRLNQIKLIISHINKVYP